MINDQSSLNSALNDFLCDLAVFYQKTRNYHWNVRGPLFFGLHEQFETLYLELAEHVDSIAERLSALGAHPRSTLKDFLEFSSLEEDLETPTALQMVANIRKDFATLLVSCDELKALADDNSDDTTMNVLDGIQDSFEKHDWMYAAFLDQ